MPGPTREIIRLLQEWSDGSDKAFDRLMPLVSIEGASFWARRSRCAARSTEPSTKRWPRASNCVDYVNAVATLARVLRSMRRPYGG